MTTTAVNTASFVQEANRVPQYETKSTCQTILEISLIALAALACFAFFVMSPIAGGITCAFFLNDYYRGEENTYARAFLNGIFSGVVYGGFSFLNAQIFTVI